MNYSKQKTAALLAVAVCAAALLAGCAKKTIVGKWAGTGPLPDGQIMTATIDYKSDGTMLLIAKNTAQAIEEAGTYKVNGDQLTQTVTDLKFGGHSVMALLPPANRANLTQTATFKITGDEMAINGKDQAATFTRVKE